MRVTTNQQAMEQLAALQSSAQALSKAQRQLSTGLRVATLGDDPGAGHRIMGNASRLRAIAQYERGLDAADQRIRAQDQVLTQVNSILQRIQELAVAASSDTMGEPARKAAAAEAEGLFGELIAQANTQVDGEYLFGGDKGTQAPFTATGTGATLSYTTTGATGSRLIEIDAGRVVAPTDDGDTVFVESGVLDGVRDLVVALRTPGAGQRDAIGAAGRKVAGAVDGLQTLVGGLGARAATMDMVRANLSAFEGSLRTAQAALREVDFEQAASELLSRQNAYQAALLASSKVLGLNLTQYLR